MSKEPLRQIIQDIISKKKGAGFKLDDNTELIESNLLESIDLLSLIIFLQEQYKISFEFNDYDKANFQTFSKIKNFINKKLE